MDELTTILLEKIEKLGDVKSSTRGKKTSFTHKKRFATITVKKDKLILDFITPSKINHTKLKKVKKLKADKFQHTTVIAKETDIDPQITGWLMIAHATN